MQIRGNKDELPKVTAQVQSILDELMIQVGALLLLNWDTTYFTTL